MSRLKALCLLLAVSSGCASAPVVPVTPGTDPVSPAKRTFDRVQRPAFNAAAVDLALPLFWTEDANHDGKLDPAELAVYWGLTPGAREQSFVREGSFTPEFEQAYGLIASQALRGTGPSAGLSPSEQQRHQAVLEELAQGRPTLVLTDLRGATPGEKRLVDDILEAATVIERIFAQQKGVAAFEAQLPPNDPASRSLMFRNQGIHCVAPRTQSNPACSAIPNSPKEKLSGLYPSGPLQKEGFCESLQKLGSPALVDPFTVVVAGSGGTFQAVPYTQAYAAEMQKVSALLKDAAAALPSAEETAFRSYLLAASQSFLDNNWAPADEAWAKMSVSNSKWYLRVGPDEVYNEPCSNKALFHLTFALINKGSLTWQARLDPLKTEMEQALATLAGPPYKARAVSFHLPDFLDVVLNAGDDRTASGATIGQSLPNFGPVANEGRGRTVAMINLYTDADSQQVSRSTAESLFCKSVMPRFDTDPEPLLMSTLLHEAAHNLGPAHQYKVNGKIDRDQFGGPLASVLEELKAQTAALFFVDWLADRKAITAEQADRTHVRDLLWAFGHISRGMYDDEHHPKTYSQLSAIQLGYLMQDKAVGWHPEEVAANGIDKGCFSLEAPAFSRSVQTLMKEVGGIKARGDRARAESLVRSFVDVSGEKKAILAVITERALRSPKSSFVYSLRR